MVLENHAILGTELNGCQNYPDSYSQIAYFVVLFSILHPTQFTIGQYHVYQLYTMLYQNTSNVSNEASF